MWAIDNNHDQITIMIRKEGSLFRRDPLFGRKSRPFLVHSRFKRRKSCEHDYDMIGTAEDDTNIGSILHVVRKTVHPRARDFLLHLCAPVSLPFPLIFCTRVAPSLSFLVENIYIYICMYTVYCIMARSFFFESFIRIKSHFLLQCTRVSEYVYIYISYFENNQWSTTTKETEVRCNDRSSSRSVVGARNRRNDFEKLSFYFYMGALSRSLTPRQRHLPYILHPLVLYLRKYS